MLHLTCICLPSMVTLCGHNRHKNRHINMEMQNRMVVPLFLVNYKVSGSLTIMTGENCERVNQNPGISR
jgi:hypothetical protein